jgi:hypothetical protein
MPETLVIKGLTYHAVYFKKPPFLFQVFPEIWADILYC